MIPDETADRIRQKKTDALAAKYLHVRRRRDINWRNRSIDFLALAVPTLYFVARYAAKGTSQQWWVELLWEAIAAVLVVMTICKMSFRWEESGQQHSTLIGENLSLVRQADALLVSTRPPSEDAVKAYFELADRIEKDDIESLAGAPTSERQEAYCDALKEFQAGTVCPICNASPWRFSAGSCQACGNTPSRIK